MLQRQLVLTKKGTMALPSRVPQAFSQEPVSACDMKVDRHRSGGDYGWRGHQ